MTRKELLNVISNRRKGLLIDSRTQAEAIEAILEVGEEIRKMREDIAHIQTGLKSNEAILGDFKIYFPVAYREAKRIFEKPPQQKPTI